MSANVETCFLNKEPAWHGLGTIVQEAPTSADALRLAGLDWNVDSSPVMVEGQEAPGYKANVRSTDRRILGIVSDRYKIVQNRDGFSFVDGLLGDGRITFESAGSLNHGSRVWILAHLPPERILDDEVLPYLVFSNSHDGSSPVAVACTPTRVVCQNTLNIALKGAKRTWTFRHMGDIEARQREAQETLMLASDYMVGLKDFAEDMANKRLSRAAVEQFVEQLLPKMPEDTPRAERNIEKMREAFRIAYNADNLGNIRDSAWGVYQAVADMVSHLEPARKTATYKENLFASLIDGNKLLESAQKILVAA